MLGPLTRSRTRGSCILTARLENVNWERIASHRLHFMLLVSSSLSFIPNGRHDVPSKWRALSIRQDRIGTQFGREYAAIINFRSSKPVAPLGPYFSKRKMGRLRRDGPLAGSGLLSAERGDVEQNVILLALRTGFDVVHGLDDGNAVLPFATAKNLILR
jgi:hypothetical protein